ncbi:hypothetical protein R1flu_004675 [Riccia fluitans]|uniref:Ubiquitin-like protease family profile domain-containing protein n=1 Tax=Riccia fluitans TaxID=41844 RepID=A0ABD1YQZ5_9MARC
MLEECERAIERNTSLEEELVIAQRKIDELEQRVKDSEAEKREMLMRVTTMGRRDLHDVRNVVDVAIENAERTLILTTVHKALSEWRVDNLLPSTSFITRHQLLASDVDRAGVETSYLSICNDFKLVAASHYSPQLFYEHLKSIFDSYVNPDNNPDVQPLVKGLDAEDFDVDAFLGANMGGPEENVTDSTVVPTIGCSIDLTADEVVDKPCSPPDHQIISVEANRCITTEWPRLSDLTKEDRESTYARKYLRGDVINAYIFEKFLQRSHEELFNMFYCNTFWFAKASQIRFVPIHERCHWSLALIRLLGTTCAVTHLDSFPGIHKKEYIFHILRTFLRLTMPISPETIVCGTMEVPHQLDQYSCGIHVIQMLAGAGMKGLGLDQCWRVDKLAWIATIVQVTTMEIMLSGWLNGKFLHAP